MIYHFDILSSTNDEATSDRYTDGDIIVAEHQEAGRGQRGHKWISGQGLNLTFSAVLTPDSFALRNQFLISQITALALCDMLKSYSIDARIKWTNDIYIGDKKIVGILIENRLAGDFLARSIVGIGLNVNQIIFDKSLPNPTSMALCVGREFKREDVLHSFERAFAERYAQMKVGEWEQIHADYNALLYRVDELHTFRLESGDTCRGTIRAVEPMGELVVEWECGNVGRYLFKQIEFVI